MPARPPGTFYLLTRPSMFLLHVPAVLAVVAAALLGNWQLGAWQMHREYRATELADAAPRALATVMGSDEPFPGDSVGRPVAASGSWMPGATVFVADRLQDGVDGYWMVVPLRTCGTDGPVRCGDPAAIPVVLGWTPTVADAPVPPRGATEIVGWLQPGEASAGPDPDLGDDVLPSLRIADLLQRVGDDLYGGFVILQTPTEVRQRMVAVTPDSLPEPPTSTGLRNLLYGIEWWLFAGLAVFLWWRWTKDEVTAARLRTMPAVSSLSAEAEAVREGESARIPSKP